MHVKAHPRSDTLNVGLLVAILCCLAVWAGAAYVLVLLAE
jgi:hypothetical protein